MSDAARITTRTREQAETYRVSICNIVASRDFARGLVEVRKGLPFHADI